MDNTFIPSRFGSSIALGGERIPGIPSGFALLADPRCVRWTSAPVHPDNIQSLSINGTALPVIARSTSHHEACTWHRTVLRGDALVTERVTIPAGATHHLYFRTPDGQLIKYTHDESLECVIEAVSA